MTTYTCLQCGSRWERERRRGASLVHCPNGHAWAQAREVRPCAFCGEEWHRVPTKGQAPKYCQPCVNAGNNNLRRVMCWVCGEACVKTSARASAGRVTCGPACLSAVIAGLGTYPTRRAFEAATRPKTPKQDGLARILAERDLPALKDYLLSRSELTPSGCWRWKQKVGKDGYPRLKSDPVHRLAYRVAYGEPPTGDHVHHACGNATCVNPEHLRLSTARENIAEMLARKAYDLRLAEADAIYLEVLAAGANPIGDSLRARILAALSPELRPAP
ncbi:HNH endonuclease [Arthrobacter phage Cassia]|uniref:HNH endonuclease n=1 Tax=Arthrobacter phage Cassia TaxID=2927275 RepID=A0AAF0K0H1_9CAUD|nr:HNH endonuclease [Arthrobacter phage Cassia]